MEGGKGAWDMREGVSCWPCTLRQRNRSRRTEEMDKIEMAGAWDMGEGVSCWPCTLGQRNRNRKIVEIDNIEMAGAWDTGEEGIRCWSCILGRRNRNRNGHKGKRMENRYKENQRRKSREI